MLLVLCISLFGVFFTVSQHAGCVYLEYWMGLLESEGPVQPHRLHLLRPGRELNSGVKPI